MEGSSFILAPTSAKRGSSEGMDGDASRKGRASTGKGVRVSSRFSIFA